MSSSQPLSLQDFVKNTLVQVFQGVLEAQKELKECDGLVAPRPRAEDPFQEFEFDVVLTSSQATASKGGIGVLLGGIGLGAQGESRDSGSSNTRVRFSVPVIFPPQPLE
ncbi:MAG: hypothetical protein HQ581_06735 [Planctomycetes bacterium]|nr:hypothetical protein [Planctomycetota bacterium]